MLQQTFITLEKAELKELITEAIREVSKNSTKHDTSEEELLNIREAAKFLRISMPTLAKYRREGNIPFYKKGRTVLFKKSELMEAMRQE